VALVSGRQAEKLSSGRERPMGGDAAEDRPLQVA